MLEGAGGGLRKTISGNRANHFKRCTRAHKACLSRGVLAALTALTTPEGSRWQDVGHRLM